ncbi:uncharacterized protein LODBEIA_P23230 [Lodderomyces beijingensis]|uniref:Endoplasmic reticulum junction formation protein lunapark n=1 Tax=Lodderomyces beijingensis TaxID=1775926 RepID=A0ABP0ZIY3_9ASCO
MGVFSIFGGGASNSFDPEKFEKELNTIAEDINKTKQQVIRVSSRKRSINNKLKLYSVILYALVLVYSYISIPQGTTATNRIQWFIKGQSRYSIYTLVGFPTLIIMLSKAINFIYKYIIKGKETYLVALKKKHRAKIEELKKITNFNATNELLNKYDEKVVPVPQQQVPGQAQLPNKLSKKQAELRAQALKDLNIKQTPKTNSQQQQPQPGAKPEPASTNDSPAKPQARSIQDRVLDILIGTDNSESIEHRYALICSHCFQHNGLAPPHCEDPSSIRYSCWKCGGMNGKGMLFDQPPASPPSLKERGSAESEKVDEKGDESVNKSSVAKDSAEKPAEKSVEQPVGEAAVEVAVADVVPEKPVEKSVEQPVGEAAVEVAAADVVPEKPEPESKTEEANTLGNFEKKVALDL